MRAAILGALALLVAAPASAATLTGTFNYRDTVTPACPGLGCVPLQPIAFAKVEIYHRGIYPWNFFALVAETSTNGAGQFSYADGRSDGTYAVRVYATNYAAQVNAASSSAYFVEPGNPGAPFYRTVYSASQLVDFSFNFTDTTISRQFNVAETVRHGRDYAALRRHPGESDVLARAVVVVTPTTSNPNNVSWYDPISHTVVLHTSDAYTDTVVLHEYAHWLEAQLSSFAWIPATHDGCEARDILGYIINSPEHAWMEGFADYFAGAVPSFLPAGTLSSLFPVALEYPAPCSASAGDAIEDFVAATLWDLHDAANETHDFVSAGSTAIFQIFDRELDIYGTWPTISHFRNAWMARNLDVPGLDRILARHQILWLPDQTAQFISMSVPTQMNVGQTYQVSITMRNTGLTTWTPAAMHRLGSQGPADNLTWGTQRVYLSSSVPPGAQTTFTFNVTAPSTAGSYGFQWKMVQDLVEWFGDFTPWRAVSVITTTPPDEGGGRCWDPSARRWVPCL